MTLFKLPAKRFSRVSKSSRRAECKSPRSFPSRMADADLAQIGQLNPCTSHDTPGPAPGFTSCKAGMTAGPQQSSGVKGSHQQPMRNQGEACHTASRQADMQGSHTPDPWDWHPRDTFTGLRFAAASQPPLRPSQARHSAKPSRSNGRHKATGQLSNSIWVGVNAAMIVDHQGNTAAHVPGVAAHTISRWHCLGPARLAEYMLGTQGKQPCCSTVDSCWLDPRNDGCLGGPPCYAGYTGCPWPCLLVCAQSSGRRQREAHC